MAATGGVWGIDIGQCALKALRCEYDAENEVLEATAFDYVEYPKILSQPDAEPKELIREALQQFLERNEVKGDSVCISVPGQNGLSRFFQPPPVDMKKLPDIVRFEARQQIPFALEEVIWDFQLMGGYNEVEGFLMEAEVGLFAMKREQVYEALIPFLKAEVEVDHIQLAPLCAYNFIAHNLLTEALQSDFYDADNPPESFVILSVGTDTTDLVITNGFRVWQRNIPLGGNHFTKQLTKDLKLTFAKAEHLKRNVREAEDAKSVIQSMRPVFNDLLTEVQRSIGFFQNIDRKAEIAGMIMLGNAVKLPGLQQYLAKNLGYDLVDFDHPSWGGRLSGQSVLNSPQFKDNIHAYGICYGLCLQGLGQAKLNTNLLPREIMTQRLIRAKKPWALATAAALMLAFSVNFFFEYAEWYKVHPEKAFDGVTWNDAMKDVDAVSTKASSNDAKDADQMASLNKLVALGRELSGNSDRRRLWLELLRAINLALPQTEGVGPNEVPSPDVLPITQREELHIEYIESQYFEDLSKWFNPVVKNKWLIEMAREKGLVPNDPEPAAAPQQPADAGEAAEGETSEGEEIAADAGASLDPDVDVSLLGEEILSDPGPSGPGWVIELKGYHYYNDNPLTWAGAHVRNTFLRNLRNMEITLPSDVTGNLDTFGMEELGIKYAILAVEQRIDQKHVVANPYYEPPTIQQQPTGPGLALIDPSLDPNEIVPEVQPPDAAAADDAPAEDEKPAVPAYRAPKYEFVVQFSWSETQLTERLRQRQEAEEAAAAAEAGGGEAEPAETEAADESTDVAEATTETGTTGG